MKLFEDMQEMGGSINDAIQQMVNDMFREELDEDQIVEIVGQLSLSDLLELDAAYTKGDKDAVRKILGPLPQLDEYSMGSNRNPTSSAAERPAPRSAGGQQASKKPGTQNTVNTNRNYSGGVQNGVSTTNVDQDIDGDVAQDDEEQIEENNDVNYNDLANRVDEWAYVNDLPFGSEHLGVNDMVDEFADLGIDTFDLAKEWVMDQIRDPNSMWNTEGNFGPDGPVDEYDDEADMANAALMYKDEGVEESAPDYNPARGGYGSDQNEDFNSHEVIRALEAAADEPDEDPMAQAGLQMLAHRINQSHPDSVTIPQIMQMLNEPELRALRKDDVEYALQAAGIMDFMEEAPVQEDKLDKAGAESIIRDMADRYQAAMAGMSHEDEWEILDQAEELAKEYGVDLDMYFESRFESREQKIIHMQEWLRRRAGLT